MRAKVGWQAAPMHAPARTHGHTRPGQTNHARSAREALVRHTRPHARCVHARWCMGWCAQRAARAMRIGSPWGVRMGLAAPTHHRARGCMHPHQTTPPTCRLMGWCVGAETHCAGVCLHTVHPLRPVRAAQLGPAASPPLPTPGDPGFSTNNVVAESRVGRSQQTQPKHRVPARLSGSSLAAPLEQHRLQQRHRLQLAEVRQGRQHLARRKAAQDDLPPARPPVRRVGVGSRSFQLRWQPFWEGVRGKGGLCAKWRSRGWVATLSSTEPTPWPLPLCAGGGGFVVSTSIRASIIYAGPQMMTPPSNLESKPQGTRHTITHKQTSCCTTACAALPHPPPHHLTTSAE